MPPEYVDPRPNQGTGMRIAAEGVFSFGSDMLRVQPRLFLYIRSQLFAIVKALTNVICHQVVTAVELIVILTVHPADHEQLIFKYDTRVTRAAVNIY